MKRWISGFLVVLSLGLLTACSFFFRPLWWAEQSIRFRLKRANVISRYVQAGRYRMHYYEAAAKGGSAGVPLILVHGLGSKGEDWSGMIPALAAQGFHVYVPDLLGYGRSDHPDVDYSISLEEKAVADFMQAVGLTHADCGGWSMGGWIAAKLAIDRPDLIARLVLYDSAGIYFPPSFDLGLFVPADVGAMRQLMQILSPIPQKLPDFIARDVLRKLQANGWVVRRSVAAMASGRDLLDFRLYRIRQPTLIVWGDRDDLIPVSVGESMHRQITHSRFELIPGCGHLAPGECAGPVIADTVSFLKAALPVSATE